MFFMTVHWEVFDLDFDATGSQQIYNKLVGKSEEYLLMPSNSFNKDITM